MGKNGNGRLAWADLLRCAALFAVVLLHVSGARLADVPVDSGAFQVLNVYDGLTHWCVPVFVMLSGAFLLDPKHSLPLPKLLFRHILRIFTALAVWGAVYAVANHLEQGGAWTWPGVREALWQALRGHTHYHLWFLYMILGLYLVTPVLRAFVRGAGRGDFHWFFLLVFVFTFLLPTLLRLRPSQTASLWIGNLNLHLVLGYVGYYVLGYYLKQNTLSRAAEFALYLLGALGAAVTVGGTALLSRQRGELVQVFYNYDSPNVALMSVAVFVLFRYVLGVSEERSRRERLSKAAQVSFGIYLVHDLFLMLLRRVGIDALSFAPALAVPVLAAGIFLCSFAVAWVLSKIPLVGRYLT
ncbi:MULTISPECIES: acyltransferase family protein [Lawsonibacter]|uniref:Acyltransferase family protein n=1 Tax=Lawsonibacter hominis TaxID=2763053 RepID=A0A8J6J6T6_9FIRM|nr:MULTISPECIES: acyltransferase family protein [Lawsonibacter]MBS1383812.1 acyltransferase family protein [Flavonifractor sp.]MDU2196177.1 acyltransferase family protein [Clostridiales bacterium]MDY2976239.1 acyltransferase family protein [Oscillospiraceae bacterium]MBC5734758.1 acyltransferase family protein [Lawsonibacter hominis]MCI6399740.1 acyltransferase family protein [Lawsonibacter sp.]